MPISLPLSGGGTKETVTCAFPGSTLGAAGVSGTKFGTAMGEGTEGALSPLSFDATTVHVYVFPFVSRSRRSATQHSSRSRARHRHSRRTMPHSP